VANEVVKYQNDFNTAVMRTWTEKEMNILFSVVSKIREVSSNKTIFSFHELKKLTGDASKQTKQNFINDLISVSKKLASLNFYEETESKFSIYILFQTFELDKSNETLEVIVHPKFEYVFNKIGMEFTQFELKEFVNINSTYAKTAYRLLKQYRTTGWWKVTLEDFRLLLDIPNSYRPSNIDQQILKPILEQLGGSDDKAIFKNLKISKDKKAGRGRGGILTGYTFSFEKEKTGEWVKDKYKTKSQKKETLPDWVDKEFSETELSEEEKLFFKKQLELLRKNK